MFVMFITSDEGDFDMFDTKEQRRCDWSSYYYIALLDKVSRK